MVTLPFFAFLFCTTFTCGIVVAALEASLLRSVGWEALREAAALRFCLARPCEWSVAMCVARLTFARASSFALCFNLPFGGKKQVARVPKLTPQEQK